MRDQLSLFLIKNSLGAKMKKGLRNFCNDDGSTSTLNQHHKTSCTTSTPSPGPGDHHTTSAVPVVRSPTNYNYYLQHKNNSNIASSDYINNPDQDHDHHHKSPPPTLEEMTLRLDLEEEIARSKYSKLNDYSKYKYYKGRMSCVNNSDILRSARNALNQYPRFSLDGKDAMYRSSFRNSLDIHNDINIVEKQPAVKAAAGGRKSACCSDYDYARRLRSGKLVDDDENAHDDTTTYTRTLQCCLPATLAGERVVWCKPGVVAKLMGLEAIPVPVPAALITTGSKLDIGGKDHKLGVIDAMNMKRRNLLIKRRAHERHEMQRGLVTNYMDLNADGMQCDHHRFINNKAAAAAAAGRRTTAASSSCTTSKTTSAGHDNYNNYCVMKPGVANA